MRGNVDFYNTAPGMQQYQYQNACHCQESFLCVTQEHCLFGQATCIRV